MIPHPQIGLDHLFVGEPVGDGPDPEVMSPPGVVRARIDLDPGGPERIAYGLEVGHDEDTTHVEHHRVNRIRSEHGDE